MQARPAQTVLERLSFQSAHAEGMGMLGPAQVDLGAAQLCRVGDGEGFGSSQPGSWVLLFQTASWASLSCREGGLQLHAGKWTVATVGSLDIQLPPGARAIALCFAADQLSRSLAIQLQTHPLAASPVSGAAKMCLELASSCLGQPEPLGRPVARAMGDCLLELAKIAIIDRFCTRRGESVRETVRTRIQAFVQRNLHDPDLTIERIAERMDCTKRYLHKVFSDEGQTLNQYIWAQRLERCRSQLARPELAGKSITEIAFECGFSNAAHFSRTFRSRFGQSPRAFRSVALDRRPGVWAPSF